MWSFAYTLINLQSVTVFESPHSIYQDRCLLLRQPLQSVPFIVGFIIYLGLAKVGMRPPAVEAGSNTPQRLSV